MPPNDYPWPYSEITPAEADAIKAMPPILRDARLRRLKAEIKSGEHALREKRRADEQAGGR